MRPLSLLASERLIAPSLSGLWMIEPCSLLIRQTEPYFTASQVNSVVELPPHFWVGKVCIPSASELTYLGWLAKFHSHWKTLVEFLIVEKRTIPVPVHTREIHQNTVFTRASDR